MTAHVRVEAFDQGRHGALARALASARPFDLKQPIESLHRCMRTVDLGFFLDATGENPIGWRFCAEEGIERTNGASRGGVSCLGELPDQAFTARVLIPSYLDAVQANRPLVHRVAAVVNGRFFAYRRLTLPMGASLRSGRPTHLLALTHVDLAIRLARTPGTGGPLTSRERECLSLAASGLLTKQIALEIGTSDKTVELHLGNARRKLGARNTAHAVAISMALAATS